MFFFESFRVFFFHFQPQMFVFKINRYYRHKLRKDYKNSEYTGNWKFTKTRIGPERKFRK
jgi:hypothetical protein